MKFLAVFAHPDDESYGPGATLARYAAAGHTVHLLTFTRGSAGTMGICKTMTPDAMAEMRTRELQCSVKALGLSGHTLLDFPDGKLAGVPAETGIGTVLKIAEDLRPDILITFHRNGISGHADHRTVSAWVSTAHGRMAYKPRLLHFGVTEEMAAVVREHRELFPIPDGCITYAIDVGPWFETHKLRAFHCHVSQLELWERFQKLPGGHKYFSGTEHFEQVWPERPVDVPLDDLLK